MTRSMAPPTVLVTGAEAFPGFGSGVDDDTAAAFVSAPRNEGSIVPLTAIVTVAFGPTVPSVQVTVPAVTAQAPADATAVGESTAGGSGSETTTSAAADGPALVTVTVQATGP